MEKHHRNKKHYCRYYAQTVESLRGRVVSSIPDLATGRFSMTDETPYLTLQMPSITPAPL